MGVLLPTVLHLYEITCTFFIFQQMIFLKLGINLILKMPVITENRTYMQATTVPLRIVAHDGSDVPIYATGAMAHLFHTTHEQHYIFYAMTYAACLGMLSENVQ